MRTANGSCGLIPARPTDAPRCARGSAPTSGTTSARSSPSAEAPTATPLSSRSQRSGSAGPKRTPTAGPCLCLPSRRRHVAGPIDPQRAWRLAGCRAKRLALLDVVHLERRRDAVRVEDELRVPRRASRRSVPRPSQLTRAKPAWRVAVNGAAGMRIATRSVGTSGAWTTTRASPAALAAVVATQADGPSRTQREGAPPSRRSSCRDVSARVSTRAATGAGQAIRAPQVAARLVDDGWIGELDGAPGRSPHSDGRDLVVAARRDLADAAVELPVPEAGRAVAVRDEQEPVPYGFTSHRPSRRNTSTTSTSDSTAPTAEA